MVQLRRVVTGACLGLGLGLSTLHVSCGGGGGGSTPSAVQAPSGLAYPANPAVYTKGQPIPANAPSVSGGMATSFSVSPALPAGLNLNGTTGVLSGTPSALAATAAYTVTASNGGGSTMATLSLTVIDQAPSGLAYSAGTATYLKGAAIIPNAPSNAGGTVVAYSIAPALPSGLAMNLATGVISGTPTAVAGTATYTVTATNTGGSATAVLNLTVNDVPPTALAYGTPSATYLRGVPIAPNLPSNAGGAVTLYTIVPALPAGLVLSPTTGVISGTPAAVTGTATFTVTASNTGGSTSVDLSLRIVEAPPENLAYAVNPATYTKGVAILPNAPSNGGGGITTYAVAPALPAGLALNPLTGVISGVPAALAPTASYIITGSNPTGSTTAVLVLTVNDAPPGGLTYSTNPAVYTKGRPIPPNIPSNGGGAISTYAVNPALPMGLVLDPASGVITGTPAALAPATVYTVTGTGGTGGSTTAALTITVKDVAPSITYGSSSFTFTTGLPVNLHATNTGGPVVTWTLSPALPAGLTFDNASGAITGTPTAIAPAAVYTITATNSGGTSSVSPTLKVNPPAPVITAQPAARTVFRGQTASFSVAATGTGPLSIQWRKNGTAIPGATASPYVTPATLLADNNAAFSAVVSDTFGGSATSSAAALTVKSGFTLAGSMALGRVYFSSVLLPSGKVLVAGGVRGGINTSDSAELYDPATGNFSPTGSLVNGRNFTTSTLLANGKVLIVGGGLATAELYDPSTGSFHLTGPLMESRAFHSATLLANGKVLIASGHNPFTGIDLTSCEVYDPTTGHFSLTGSMTTSRTEGVSILLPNGKVLIQGGAPSGGSAISAPELYDPATGLFTPITGPQPSARGGHTMTLLQNGKVLLAGGQTTGGAVILSTELYDSSSGTFSTTGSLNLRRLRHTAHLLPNNQVILIGGYTGTWFDDPRSEIYNPATGVWELSAPINVMRHSHTSTVLSDGRLLVIGGGSPSGAELVAQSEIYQ